MTMTSLESYLNSIWEQILNNILSSGKYDKVVYDAYIQKTKLVDLNDTTAIITTPERFGAIVLENEKPYFDKVMSEITQREIQCKFVFENDYIQNQTVTKTVPQFTPSIEDNVLPDFTFDNFVVGSSNKEAHSAALACALNPGKFYNPLFIYGDSGLGKTHLMYAIGNFIKKNQPEKNILYIPASDFIDRFYMASKSKNIDEFKMELKAVDVLLVDDIQILAGKEKTNETFFQIYNSLVNNRKQIILTSDKPPLELNDIEERLISRFSSGLSVTINSPEFETRLEILKLKAKTQGTDFSSLCDEESLSYIATNCTGDVRSLEGMLTRLVYYSINFGKGQKITYDFTVEALKDMISNANINKNNISPSFIINTVANYYGLTKQQILSKSRIKSITTARHISMYLCRKHLDMPYKKIGATFNKCDHATVISACTKIEKLLKDNPQYQQAILDIENKLT